MLLRYVLLYHLLVVIEADWRLFITLMVMLGIYLCILMDRRLFRSLDHNLLVLLRLIIFLIAREFHTKAESWLQAECVKKLRKQIVKFDVELLVFIHGVREVDVRHPAEEVHELREGQLSHPFAVPNRVDDCHDGFGEDDADHGLRHI